MSGVRRALCVGINHFQNYSGSDLQGCVNDAHAMVSILKDFEGYQDPEIVLLTDEQATKANIMHHLKEMVGGAIEGRYSQLAFSLSSHGTEIKDRNPGHDEVYDEAFCPHDLAEKGGDWDPEHIIVDDELRALFSQIPANVVYHVFLDTCHSGTGLRELTPGRKAKYIPPPWKKDEKPIPPPAVVRASTADGNRNHVLWAACAANQTSADAFLEGGWHGAFTYFLNQELRATGGGFAQPGLLDSVRSDLKNENFKQRPQLEIEPTRRR